MPGYTVFSGKVNRRQVVKAACAAASVGPAIYAWGNERPSSRVRIGLIGCGGRGRQLLEIMREYPDVELPVISDVIEAMRRTFAAVGFVWVGLCSVFAVSPAVAGQRLEIETYADENHQPKQPFHDNGNASSFRTRIQQRHRL